MAYFVENLSQLILVLFILTCIGFGPALLFSAKKKVESEILLAPLIGAILVAALGYYRVLVLIRPLSPMLDAYILLGLSGFLTYLSRAKLGLLKDYLTSRKFKTLLIIPCLFLVFFALVFHKEGFTLLSGTEDELQYCANASHMLRYLHTGAPEDVPAPRIDHWVYDFATRSLNYNETYRKGAELTLASVSNWLKRTPEECFPLTVGVFQLLLTLIAGFLATRCFGISEKRAILFQIFLTLTFQFLLYHLTGSLANLLSLPMFFGIAGVLSQATTEKSKGGYILAGILASGIILYYAEVAVIGLFLPLACFVIWELFTQWDRRIHFVQGLFLMSLVTLVISYRALFAVYLNTLGNFQVVLAGLTTSHSSTLGHSLFNNLAAHQWFNMSYAFGLISQHDMSNAGAKLVSLIIKHPKWILFSIVLTYITAIAGYLKVIFSNNCSRSAKNTAFYMASVFIIYIATTLVTRLSADDFRFFRSSEYTTPFCVFGLGLFCSTIDKESLFFKKTRLVQAGIAFVAYFLLANSWTIFRTVRHINHYDFSNDPILHRLNPRSWVWLKLKEELRPSQDVPVLISGFTFTGHIHWIVNAIDPIPHLLGKSIYELWHIMDLTPVPRGEHYGFEPVENTDDRYERIKKRYPCLLSGKQIAQAQRRPNWNYFIPLMLEKSRQAIIPTTEEYPPEWSRWRDIYSPRRTEYANIGAVVYKTEKSIVLAPEGTGPLEEDQNGIYRKLKKETSLQIQDWRSSCFLLKVRYDGKPGQVQLMQSARIVGHSIQTTPNQTEIQANISYSEAAHLTLAPKISQVKLRRVQWMPSNCL